MSDEAVQEENHEEQDSQGKQFSDQVIDLYESCLRNALIISTSFKGIKQNNLDPKRRLLQTIFLLALGGYGVPRYFTLCFLNLKDEETRKSFEFFLPNYLEQLGLIGKVFNFCYIIFGTIIAIDMIHFRIFESKGRLDYLTNMDSLRCSRKSSSIEVDSNQFLGEVKEKLLKRMRTKLMILKNYMFLSYLSLDSYHLISCPLYLYNERPHLITSILIVVDVLIQLFVYYYASCLFMNTYMSYILTVDYFSARIDFMMKGLKESISLYDKISRLLIQYNQLMNDFAKQDYLLKYLLRNMMYCYYSGLTMFFFLFTIDMNPFLRVFLLISVCILAVMMLLTGLYFGSLHSMTLVLYGDLNSMAARNCHSITSYEVFKPRRILLNCIKEIGSQQTDGQYVFGLRDGHGPAISSLEMFHLTMAAISNTLMVMEFMYH